MYYKKKRKIIIFVLIIVAAIIAVTALITSNKKNSEITGTEWFASQHEYVEDLGTYADNMDNIITLYITDSISQEDFVVHLSVLQQELEIMETVYREAERNNPVKTGTHTYETKKACESVKDCYVVFGNILDMAYNNAGDKEALTYKYIAYQQEIADNIAQYLACFEVLIGGTQDE